MAFYDLIKSPQHNKFIAMSVIRLCQKFFTNTLNSLHQGRRKTLQDISCALASDAHLTVTSLGRSLPGQAKVKHKIKRVDRFIGNAHLYFELPSIYQALITPIFRHLTTAVIAVDWSGCCGRDFHVLRASLLYQGRSLPIYNRVVPEQQQGARQIQSQFLQELHAILPKSLPVIIVTDGGFKTPWFHEVRRFGWDFIGRLRNPFQFRFDGQNQWQKIQSLHPQATTKPRYLGHGRLGKEAQYPSSANLYIFKDKPKGRKTKRPVRHSKNEREYSALNREPWLLATSLTGGQSEASKVIRLYHKRMQIEQNFRDDKNHRWGFGWRYSRTRGCQRLSVMCLIATVTTWLLWFIGHEAEKRGLHRYYQANSVTHKRVLSYLFLARQMIRHEAFSRCWSSSKSIAQDIGLSYSGIDEFYCT